VCVVCGVNNITRNATVLNVYILSLKLPIFDVKDKRRVKFTVSISVTKGKFTKNHYF
jgi:hypothetical protein